MSLPVLVDWVKDERVLPDTWIFARARGDWQKASEISELENFFQAETGTDFYKPIRRRPVSSRVRCAGLKSSPT